MMLPGHWVLTICQVGEAVDQLGHEISDAVVFFTKARKMQSGQQVSTLSFSDCLLPVIAIAVRVNGQSGPGTDLATDVGGPQ